MATKKTAGNKRPTTSNKLNTDWGHGYSVMTNSLLQGGNKSLMQVGRMSKKQRPLTGNQKGKRPSIAWNR